MWEFLSALFCGKQRQEIRDLTRLKDELAVRLGECEIEKQDNIQQYLTCVQEKIEQGRQLREQITELNEEIHSLEQSEILLQAALRKAIIIPDISEYIGDETPEVVIPNTEIQYRDYELHYADLRYSVFPYDAWIQILTDVHQEIEKVLISWVTDISDCNNWAFSTADIVSLTCKKVALRYQGAFPVLWSWIGKHAYNGFVTDEWKTYVYEPQNNTVIGLLGETTDHYETEMIWFPQ